MTNNLKIAFWTHKGGIGKTFLSSQVAYRAMEKDIPLKVFDADPQTNGMKLISGLKWKRGESYNYRNGSVLVTMNLDDINEEDFTLYDAPPQSNFFDTVVESGLPVNIWILPFGDDQMEYEAMKESVEVIRNIEKDYRIILVCNNMNTYSKQSEKYIGWAKEMQVEMYKYIIPSRAVVKQSRTQGVATWKCKPVSQDDCSLEARKFADWILGGCNDNFTFNLTQSQLRRAKKYVI